MTLQLNSSEGVGQSGPLTSPEVQQVIIDAFHRIYWTQRTRAIQWRGHNMIKWPADLMTYADILHKKRPDVLIETGTYYGGSAIFFADCMDRNGKGVVISVDINPGSRRPEHSRVLYLQGDSVAAAETIKEHLAAIEEETGKKLKVMVSLDSDHRKAHVDKELEAYKDIVTPGQYMVVEDTNLNGHPVHPEHGPGPWEAVQEFTDPRFKADEALARRHLFSMHTWLLKEDA